ncbi:hypothetical protein [Sorangium sp. So ce693]|uniref:hypothetical protein n=1 Tax=Sorangium sp. So ce693 TaxID=3133318 RepID=UPI003F5D6738
MADSPWLVLLDKGITAIVAIGSLWIGARLTRRAAELADARKAKSEEELERRRLVRKDLESRLSDQREAYDIYCGLQVKASLLLTETDPRKHMEIHGEVLSTKARLDIAFGDDEFSRAAVSALSILAGPHASEEAYLKSGIQCRMYSTEMLRVIGVTKSELNLPAGESPRPVPLLGELVKDNTDNVAGSSGPSTT